MPTAETTLFTAFDWPRIAQVAVAWLATYWLHSTLLLSGAWLVGRRLGARHLPAQEVLWKVALIGGLATATVQLSALEMNTGRPPLAGAWSLPAAVVADGAPTTDTVDELGATVSPDRPTAEATVRSSTASPLPASASFAGESGDPDGVAGLTAGTAAAARTGSPPPAVWLLALWAAVALLLSVRLASAHLRLALRLRGRQPIADGPLVGLLDRLRTIAGVRRPVGLSRTRSIPVPIARGLAHSEICLPQRALDELGQRQQESMLAHELAHVRRRDPVWLVIAGAIESLFFFQPLHRLARIRLREIAEYRCDDWAARVTGEPLSLARCLTQVAGWSLAPARALPAMGMAGGRSGLSQRIRRLVERGGEGDSRPRWLLPAAAAALALVVAAAPGVRSSIAGPLPTDGNDEVSRSQRGAEVEQDEEDGNEARDEDAAAIEAAIEADFARQQEAAEAERVAETQHAEVRWEIEETEEAEEAEEAEEEAAEQIAEAFEEEMERFEDEIERALEPLEDEIEGRMETFDESFEYEMERFEDEFEGELESMMDEFEATFEEIEWQTEGDPEAFAATFAATMAELGARVGSEAAAFAQAFAPMEEMSALMEERFDDDFEQHVESLVEAAVPDHQELERLGPELERLQAEARRLAAESRFEGAEAEELRQQARELAERLHPTREELERLRAETRRLAHERVPTQQELERIRTEQRRAMDTWRAEHAEELERLRADLRQERERLRQREEARERARDRQRQEGGQR